MPDVKTFRVRHAKPAERGLFMRLWKELLERNHKSGDYVSPSSANVERMARLFDLYTSGEKEGVVLFVADKAVVMAGAAGEMLDTHFRKPAVLWGLYIEEAIQGKGVMKILRDRLTEELDLLGFSSLIVTMQSNDTTTLERLTRLGFKPATVFGSLSLEGTINGEEKQSQS